MASRAHLPAGVDRWDGARSISSLATCKGIRTVGKEGTLSGCLAYTLQ